VSLAANEFMAKIDAFFNLMFEQKASDLHMASGNPPMLRINGELQRVDYPPLESDSLKTMLYEIAPDYKIKQFEETGDVDFGYEIPNISRFRVNFFNQKNGVAAVFRQIPSRVLSFEDFEKLDAPLPAVLKKFAMLNRGLVVVTGPTGSGKSTTLAAMVDYANRNRKDHIITIEDPIEFLHRDKRSFINQREVEVDTANFSSALRAGLRQDPDVILVGEMRDLETISTALLAAETGHLVFSTLHTLDATETIQRIIAVFPPPEQKQIRLQMAATLKAVVSQRLVRRADDKGRVPAVEVMIATGYIRDCIINADKTRLIHDAIAAGTSQYGMQTFDQSLFDLYSKELITLDEALSRASNADEFKLRIQGIRSAADAAREEMASQMADFERFSRK